MSPAAYRKNPYLGKLIICKSELESDMHCLEFHGELQQIFKFLNMRNPPLALTINGEINTICSYTVTMHEASRRRMWHVTTKHI